MSNSSFIGPSDQDNIERSADGIDTTITFPADQNTVEVSFTLTDDNVGLEDIESYLVSLELIGTPVGVDIGDIPEATVNVLDDEGWSTSVVMISKLCDLFLLPGASEATPTYTSSVRYVCKRKKHSRPLPEQL